jgi:hypothetical protein
LLPEGEIEAIKTEFRDVFEPIPAGLPPDRGVSHAITLQPGHKPPYRGCYRMSPAETAEVRKQVSELLAKGCIRPSDSPYGSPLLFVAKKDGSLRMVYDYRALNAITIPNRWPLPRIDDTLDRLQGSTI